MKVVKFHALARAEIRELGKEVRNQLGDLLYKLQLGLVLRMPHSRPMPIVYQGAHELRISDSAGTYRIFYFLKQKEVILLFYVFTKKSQRTEHREIIVARKRLMEMIEYENQK
jgi:phage-related protein